jgi:hypothetical protein
VKGQRRAVLCLLALLPAVSSALAGETEALEQAAAPAAGTAALAEAPVRPEAARLAPESHAPEALPLPTQGPSAGPLTPRVGDRALVAGQWVSPQWVLGRATDLPRAPAARLDPTIPATNRIQPPSRVPEPARGFDPGQVVRPPLVARYAQGPVVRFVPPPEMMAQLIDELSLDELNRYQFRRNRPAGVPVEQPRSRALAAPP